jgi:hypothetical protein
MLKSFISVFLIFRLESRPASLDLGSALSAWLRRPSIEILLDERRQDQDAPPGEHLKRKLNEVYPF